MEDGGVLFDGVILGDGRIALRYPDQVFVSTTPTSDAKPPESLHFRPLLPAKNDVYNFGTNQMVRWKNGLALIFGGRPELFNLTGNGTATGGAAPVEIAASGLKESSAPTGIFNVRDVLWETFEDGRACRIEPGPSKCWAPPGKAGSEPFQFVGSGEDGQVLARSEHLLATIDPVSGRQFIEELPFQGAAYDARNNKARLFRDQRGDLVTQASDGLIVRHGTRWEHLTVRDGIPGGVIANMLTDRGGQVWAQVTGTGLFRGLGYGSWENLQQDDGLSDRTAWQTRKDRKGSLWVTTDAAIDQVRWLDGRPKVVSSMAGAAFAVSVSRQGDIWAGLGNNAVIELDPETGHVSSFAVPSVEALAPGHGRMWVGTNHGLFDINDHGDEPRRAERDSPDKGLVISIMPDGGGGAYFLAAGRLWHRHGDGSVGEVSGAWPTGGFEPLTMIPDTSGGLWLGGAGGLFHLILTGDRMENLVRVGRGAIKTNTIVALCLDTRGWLWVGTGLGVSVFDGQRWVSVNSTQGLVWDDISQHGIYEDPDGSIWIATSLGLSHLLRPEWVFRRHPLKIVLSSMRIGTSVLRGGKLHYSKEPLSIDLGVVSYEAEDSVVFRYRLSDVDRTWADSTAGAIRYAYVPPGRHVFNGYAVDTLTNTRSTPISLTIAMAYPWWEGWWAEASYATAVLAFVVGFAKLCEAFVRARAALRRQATIDSLTGLLNRAEVERRIAKNLSVGGRPSRLAVAIVDVDHFKKVNDDYGHLVGDTVLQEIGTKTTRCLGPRDYAGRYGGEELLMVLDDTEEMAIDRITGFHQAVREYQFMGGKTGLKITCSIGVAWRRSTDDWESLVGRADAALYLAKRTGRDTIVEDRWAEDGGASASDIGIGRLIKDDAD